MRIVVFSLDMQEEALSYLFHHSNIVNLLTIYSGYCAGYMSNIEKKFCIAPIQGLKKGTPQFE